MSMSVVDVMSMSIINVYVDVECRCRCRLSTARCRRRVVGARGDKPSRAELSPGRTIAFLMLDMVAEGKKWVSCTEGRSVRCPCCTLAPTPLSALRLRYRKRCVGCTLYMTLFASSAHSSACRAIVRGRAPHSIYTHLVFLLLSLANKRLLPLPPPAACCGSTPPPPTCILITVGDYHPGNRDQVQAPDLHPRGSPGAQAACRRLRTRHGEWGIHIYTCIHTYDTNIPAASAATL